MPPSLPAVAKGNICQIQLLYFVRFELTMETELIENLSIYNQKKNDLNA